jgi:hypothetical protein
MFDKIKSSPYRKNFQVVVGGSGGWQITQTNSFEELGVDCVAEGRSESADTLALFQRLRERHCREKSTWLIPPRAMLSSSPTSALRSASWR